MEAEDHPRLAGFILDAVAEDLRTGRFDYQISPPTGPDLKALAETLRRAQRQWRRAGPRQSITA